MKNRHLLCAFAAIVCVVYSLSRVEIGYGGVVGLSATSEGSYDLLSTELLQGGSTALWAYNGGSTYNYHLAVEFNLAEIPANAQIIEATFRIRYNGANGSRTETLQFHGYAGDGVMSPSDFLVNNPIGPRYNAFGPPLETQPFYEVPVTSFIQSLVDANSTYAGFMAENVAWNQTSLCSSLSGPSYEPKLDITFVPEPSALLLLAIGIAAVSISVLRHRR